MAKPRVKIPKSAKVGDVVQIKTLITHKMETGLRKDKKTGEIIPRQIINSFAAKYNGKEVFRAKMHPAISANPYISFFMKVPGPGEFEFIWVDDTGKSWSTKKKLAVS
ncbi:MAG: thiosulfate oxidation carrier complex protein SoxZ [Hyphomicrobiaceae bacterium]